MVQGLWFYSHVVGVLVQVLERQHHHLQNVADHQDDASNKSQGRIWIAAFRKTVKNVPHHLGHIFFQLFRSELREGSSSSVLNPI